MPGLKRRHPAEVTADRLGDVVTRWADRFDATERDTIGHIIQALDEIADGRRQPGCEGPP